MNVLNCTICFSDARPELVNWPMPEVPSMIVPNVVNNFYYTQPYMNLTDSWYPSVQYIPPVPEPSMVVLLTIGLVIGYLYARRKDAIS